MADKATEFVQQLKDAKVRVTSDSRDNYTPGWKYNHWELKVCHLPPRLLAAFLPLVTPHLSFPTGGSHRELKPWHAWGFSKNFVCKILPHVILGSSPTRHMYSFCCAVHAVVHFCFTLVACVQSLTCRSADPYSLSFHP